MARVGPGLRIDRSEVLKRAHKRLLDIGAGNHCQAEFVRSLSQSIIGSSNPAFIRFQPIPHGKSTPAWDQAYALVYQYLLFHKFAFTFEVADNEFPTGKSDIPVFNPDEVFHELIGAGATIGLLPARVEELFPKKKKKSGQTTSPRGVLRRSAKGQSGSRRRAGKTPVGKGGQSGNSAIRISSPPRQGRGLESDDLGSDIVITEIIDKRKK
jgi:hypothetical protein